MMLGGGRGKFDNVHVYVDTQATARLRVYTEQYFPLGYNIICQWVCFYCGGGGGGGEGREKLIMYI